MANTYSCVYFQVVFAVKGRQNLISSKNREEIQKYMSGIIANRNQKLMAIYCMPDHVHVLISFKPSCVISDLVRDIKAGSSTFINEKNWIRVKFQWQESYGLFSYSPRDVPRVIDYILNQEQHHSKTCFKTEYIALLKEYEIEYDEKYLFEWIE